jgi:hypothetical protein
MIRECLWLIWAAVSLLLMGIGWACSAIVGLGVVIEPVEGFPHGLIPAVIALGIYFVLGMFFYGLGWAGYRRWKNRAKPRADDRDEVATIWGER